MRAETDLTEGRENRERNEKPAGEGAGFVNVFMILARPRPTPKDTTRRRQNWRSAAGTPETMTTVPTFGPKHPRGNRFLRARGTEVIIPKPVVES